MTVVAKEEMPCEYCIIRSCRCILLIALSFLVHKQGVLPRLAHSSTGDPRKKEELPVTAGSIATSAHENRLGSLGGFHFQ
jgi:hypothetical protein